MKKYLDNKKGMALPMVLIIMTILMILGTGLAVIAYNSYVSVRWMNAEKKAYYLSRAGVEAAAYAYQNATTKTSAHYGKLNEYASYSEFDKLVTVSESGTKLTTNRVYLCYSTSDANEGTTWDGLAFKTYASESEALADEGYIGYFEVEIGEGIDKVSVEADGSRTEQDVKVKVFRCKAVCDDKTNVMFGYIIPPESSTSLQLYDADGYLSTDAVTKEEAKANGSGGKFIVTNKTIVYNTDITDPNDSWLTRFFKGVVKAVFNFLNETTRDIPMYFKTSEGNVILTKPANSKNIKVNPDKDNFYVFATTGNLFLKETGISATPTKGYYASIGLYGDQIVVDGDITMEVFINNPDSLLPDAIQTTMDTIGNRFRLGTVVIGDASSLGTSRVDPVPVSKGGLKYNGNSVPANKIYFNGNVYVKIYTQGAATETYRVFNAGDMAYFYGAYSAQGKLSEEAFETRGLDLLKYFVDAVLAEKDGHVYGEALKRKMREINELYYGGVDSSYFTNDNVFVRKIQVEYDASGNVYVDKIDGVQYGNIDDILQPDGTDSSSIVWGRPRGGDVFAE